MAANTLAPCIARSSAAMILTMQDKWALVIYKDKFQLPVPYYDWEMLVTDCRYIFMFPKVNLWWHGLTHWGQVTQICVNNLTIISSDNGLSPHRRQAIIWTDAGILLIPPLRNQIQWNLNQNSHLFIQENALENTVCKMAAILCWLQCVNP